MRTALAALCVLAAAAPASAQFPALPANTWVPIKPQTVQPADPAEKGQWMNVGWNKLVYDPDAKRVLFYDRWHDKKHGGYTIYGNCLFSLDPATAKLTPLKIDNWSRRPEGGGYRTILLAENDKEPTPCPRHVYHGFDYVSDLKAVFISNGANQTAMLGGTLLGHDLCADTWRFDLAAGRWAKIDSKEHPRNSLEDGMAYCPDIKSIVYAGHGKLWILDLAAGQWHKAKQDLPRNHMGMAVFYDAPRKRMLLVGGGSYDRWHTKAGGFNTVYAFDPKTEAVTRLADCPTALCRAGMAHDLKRDLWLAVAVLKGEKVEQPSGMFCWDPVKDAWHEVKPANAIPATRGWMPLCWDRDRDCFIGMERETFHAFRYEPGK